ncbi:Nucleoporin-like protein 2 [Amphibalanus amphitrite]|uniref:Nucleoporin NUP42 n=1 Tax=Amphibalanus amphitrite TaxID=1232801 RepID=A0A6A4XCH0_AMPAM|nr:Nucleoporin-like protein 2 [Amphibalanus amphitrite]KAF0312838.1 Nucleoporin-like protein 2 [Amphibalanus amphitrite]KAF0312839.1 Nucleoporin-like protein 2 [Amphibalanus amphitrite]
MVVCTYYNQGYCRYGDRCRFDHPFKGPTAGAGANYRAQAQQPAAAAGTPSSFNELLTGIANEMKVWENSKQWPFSCFSPLKGQPCIPGLTDLSPEEVRAEAYKSKVANTPDAYLQFFNAKVAEYRQKRASLHNASPEMRTYMPQTTGSTFGGQTPAASSVFGSQPAPAAAAPAGSVFGGQAALPGAQPAGGGGGLFGKGGAPAAGAAGTQPTAAPADAYSEPSELSEQDREQFAAAEFTLGKVPLVPPTREMCAR